MTVGATIHHTALSGCSQEHSCDRGPRRGCSHGHNKLPVFSFFVFLKTRSSISCCEEREPTAETLAEQTSVSVLVESIGAVAPREGAVFQRRTQHGADRFIRGLWRTKTEMRDI